ncbi:MAG: proline--tRNA ligase [Chloroflexi bacterium]|nr:proline--tRNA ligase [Chloroflexota bacterium]
MRLTRYFGKTLRQAPSDADTISHQLLVRAGYIQQLAAGSYQFLPLGWRMQQKISDIIREEMDAAGALEVSMPVIQPREIWEQSGRAETFIPPLAGFQDRRGREMVVAPTHEEAVTTMVKANVNSYRDLPVNLYQIQTKFRDEPRPRAGLLRTREFMMKDAYSFDATQESLDNSYDLMVKAYINIFTRCGLEVAIVEADSGGIGGKDSQEFILLAENGEDVVLLCENGDYGANVEKAEFVKQPNPEESPLEMEEIATPGIKTIDELAKSLGIPTNKTAKAVFYTVGGEVIVVTIRGDLDVNEVKLRNILGGVEPRFSTPKEVANSNLVPGSASAVGLDGIRSIVDDSLTLGSNFVAGANKEGFHIKNVNFPRDFKGDIVADIAKATAGDVCPRDGGIFHDARGIEVGHVFKLGTIYSKDFDANFLDETGESHPIIMGCYGLGVSRLVGGIVEAHHDENGMTLPAAIAPYLVYLASLNVDDEGVREAADGLYAELTNAGLDVLYDDRDEKPGVKFKDADLIGIPVRVVVSRRGLNNGQIELKLRTDREATLVPTAEVRDAVKVMLGR